MDDKLTKFRDAAIKSGYSENEVNSFLDMVKSAPQKKEEVSTQEKKEEVSTQVASFEPNFSSITGTVGYNQGGIYTPVMTAEEQKNLSNKVIPVETTLTQAFGNLNPIEKFSGGFNRGADFSIPKNTPLSVPAGDWMVSESFNGAKSGGVGNATNRGYGNSVVLVNRLTGERIRYSHLNSVNVKPGQLVKPGQTVAYSGSTGNSTGPHLDVEYYNSQGKLSNILTSKYSNQFI